MNAGPGLLYTPADSDEDDYGISDGMGGVEGARIDSALYDVYSSGQMGNARGYPPAPAMSAPGRAEDPATPHRHYEGAAAIPGRQLPVPHSHFIPASARRWTSVFGPGASNTNNNTPNNLPRAAHPLTGPAGRNYRFRPTIVRRIDTEFSEFAARRRSSHRQLLQGRDGGAPENSQRLRVPNSHPAEILPPAPSTFYDLPRATLFEPPSPSSRENATRVPSPSPSTEAEETQPERLAATMTRPPMSRSSSFLHESHENNDISTNPHPLLGGTLAEWRSHAPPPTAPRIPLRRGSVQAPETILPPADSILPPDADPLGRVVIPSSLLRPESDVDDGFERELQAFDAWSAATDADRMFTSERQHHEGTTSSSVPPQEAPTSLPTPRSVSPTGENQRSSVALDGPAQ